MLFFSKARHDYERKNVCCCIKNCNVKLFIIKSKGKVMSANLAFDVLLTFFYARNASDIHDQQALKSVLGWCLGLT